MNGDNSRENRIQNRACVDNGNVKIEKKEEDHEVSSIPDILEEIEFKDEIIEQLTLEQLVTGGTAEVKLLAKLVTGLKADIKKLSSKVYEIRGMLDDKSADEIITPISHRKYTLHLPLKTPEEFYDFDKKIGDNDEFQAHSGRFMLRLVRREKVLTRVLKKILHYYLSRDLAMKFTTIRRLTERLVFKDTNFCSFMLDIIVQFMYERYPQKSPITEEKFYQALGYVLHNAKKWSKNVQMKKISFA